MTNAPNSSELAKFAKYLQQNQNDLDQVLASQARVNQELTSILSLANSKGFELSIKDLIRSDSVDSDLDDAALFAAAGGAKGCTIAAGASAGCGVAAIFSLGITAGVSAIAVGTAIATSAVIDG